MIDYAEIQKKKRDARFRVAILSTIPGGAHGEVVHWLKWTNERSDEMFRPYTYFSIGTDDSSVTITIQRILSKNYDLIVCVGRFITSTVHRLTAEMPNPPSVVFCLAANPVEQGLIDSMQSSGNHLVGIEMGDDPTQRAAEYFLKICPNVQKVLLPFCSPRFLRDQSWRERYVDPFAAILSAEGKTVTVAPFAHTDAALDAIEADTYDVDAIVVLAGDPLLSMYGPLGGYCSARNIIFYANSRSAVRCSAALGFSCSYKQVGIAMTHLIQEILFNNRYPSDMPTVRLKDESHPLINIALAAEQGVEVENIEKKISADTEVFTEKGPFPAPYDE